MSILVPVPRIKDMSGYRQLTPQEIEALREDMRQSSEWARAELKRRRELREGSIVISPDNPVISGDNNPNG
ncbi:hypothetical protein Aerorivi_04919 (plasmid) [Aeromonas rivipollensis]|jgi:hypothetical protein